MTKSWNRELRKWVHAQHDENFNDFANRRVAIEGYEASISHNVSEYAADFKVPTLVMVGTRDDITSVKQQKAMFAKIKTKSSLVVLPNAGHLTHYECPEKVGAAIDSFITSLAATN
jgi:pimeloyl-ACP methyl ester carboxylesterase